MRGNALTLQPEIHNKAKNHRMKEYMRYIVTTIGAMMLCLSAWAQDSVSISRADYDALLRRIENIEQREGIKPEGKSAKLRQIGSGEEYQKFRFGGYGEILAQFMNYDPKIIFDGRRTGSLNSTNAVSIPRFVLAGDYRFNKHWNLGVEIEFEAGGVGLEYEMEGGSEGNEHEVEYEKGGEVALEQFHVTYTLNPTFNVRAGHLILPVGLTNAHHEPILFFGTSRPEGETTILPSTWHETGLEVFGRFGKNHARMSYQAMVVAGLTADGFGTANWVASGKAGLFEKDNFTSPAYVARLNYHGVPGLRLGASVYYCNNTAANADEPQKYTTVKTGEFRVPVTILTADAQYTHRIVTARANVIWGKVGNSDLASKNISGKSPYYHNIAFRTIARNALAYGVEAGLNLRNVCGTKKCPVLYPFGRYEYYNPQEKGTGKQTMDSRYQVSKWSAGLNWFALPNLVVKADFTTRRIGTQRVFGGGVGNRENEFAIAIAYTGWFSKK